MSSNTSSTTPGPSGAPTPPAKILTDFPGNFSPKKRASLMEAIPKFNTNIKDDEGETPPEALENNKTAITMLSNLLSHLSPMTTDAAPHAAPRIAAARRRFNSMSIHLGGPLEPYDPRASVGARRAFAAVSGSANNSSNKNSANANGSKLADVGGRASLVGRQSVGGVRTSVTGRSRVPELPVTRPVVVETQHEEPMEVVEVECTLHTGLDKETLSQLRDCTVLGDYVLEATIGEGCFSKVKKATHFPTGHKVAIKCMDKSAMKKSVGTAERTLREIMVLSHLYHANITQLLEVVDTEQFIYLILEYESGGELFDYLAKNSKTPEDTARKFFRQLLSAIQYCHANGVVHRDLKPENLLLDAKQNIKIIDFGFANIVRDDGKMQSFCGSPAYAPPEMIGRKTYSGPGVDIWAMGVILYVLICGQLPFDDKHMGKMFVDIMMGKYFFPEGTPEGAKSLISSMLKVKPTERATLEQIRDHPWTNDNGNLPTLEFFAVDPETPLDGPHEPSPMEHLRDEDLVQELIKIGFSDAEIQHARESGVPCPASAAYHLLRAEKKRKQSENDRKSRAGESFSNMPAGLHVTTHIEMNESPTTMNFSEFTPRAAHSPTSPESLQFTSPITTDSSPSRKHFIPGSYAVSTSTGQSFPLSPNLQIDTQHDTQVSEQPMSLSARLRTKIATSPSSKDKGKASVPKLSLVPRTCQRNLHGANHESVASNLFEVLQRRGVQVSEASSSLPIPSQQNPWKCVWRRVVSEEDANMFGIESPLSPSSGTTMDESQMEVDDPVMKALTSDIQAVVGFDVSFYVFITPTNPGGAVASFQEEFPGTSSVDFEGVVNSLFASC